MPQAALEFQSGGNEDLFSRDWNVRHLRIEISEHAVVTWVPEVVVTIDVLFFLVQTIKSPLGV